MERWRGPQRSCTSTFACALRGGAAKGVPIVLGPQGGATASQQRPCDTKGTWPSRARRGARAARRTCSMLATALPFKLLAAPHQLRHDTRRTCSMLAMASWSQGRPTSAAATSLAMMARAATPPNAAAASATTHAPLASCGHTPHT